MLVVLRNPPNPLSIFHSCWTGACKLLHSGQLFQTVAWVQSALVDMNHIYRVVGLFPARPSVFGIKLLPLHGESFAWFILLLCFWCTYSQERQFGRYAHSTNPLTFVGELLLASFLYLGLSSRVSHHMHVASLLVSYVCKQSLHSSEAFRFFSHPPSEDIE